MCLACWVACPARSSGTSRTSQTLREALTSCWHSFLTHVDWNTSNLSLLKVCYCKKHEKQILLLCGLPWKCIQTPRTLFTFAQVTTSHFIHFWRNIDVTLVWVFLAMKICKVWHASVINKCISLLYTWKMRFVPLLFCPISIKLLAVSVEADCEQQFSKIFHTLTVRVNLSYFALAVVVTFRVGSPAILSLLQFLKKIFYQYWVICHPIKSDQLPCLCWKHKMPTERRCHVTVLKRCHWPGLHQILKAWDIVL